MPTLVSFAIAVAILVFLATRFSIDLDATWETIHHSSPFLYGAALVVHYTTFPFRGARWRMLLRNAGVEEVAPLPSLVAAARLVLLGWFASSITWFRLGDAYRAYAYCEESGASLSRSMGTVVAERVMDVLLVFLLILAGFLLLYADPKLRPSETFLVVALGLALASGLFLLAMQLFRKGVFRLLPRRIHRGYRGFHEGTMRSFRTLPPVLLVGLLGWLSEVGRLYLVVRATGLEVGFGLILFVTVANALLTAVPLSPGGLGIVETGIVGLLAWTLPREDAVSIALMDRSISYLSVILLGAVAFVYHQRVAARHPAASYPSSESQPWPEEGKAMARVSYISREDLPASKRDLYDQIASQRGHVARPFAALLNSPEVASRVAAIGEHLRYEASIVSPQVREIVTLTTASQLGCQYVWTHHEALARETGVREEVIEVIRDGAPPRRLLPKEGVFIQFTRELLNERHVRDTTFSAVEHLLGPQGTTDLVVTIGYYALLCYTIAALGVELEEDMAPLLPESAGGQSRDITPSA